MSRAEFLELHKAEEVRVGPGKTVSQTFALRGTLRWQIFVGSNAIRFQLKERSMGLNGVEDDVLIDNQIDKGTAFQGQFSAETYVVVSFDNTFSRYRQCQNQV